MSELQTLGKRLDTILQTIQTENPDLKDRFKEYITDKFLLLINSLIQNLNSFFHKSQLFSNLKFLVFEFCFLFLQQLLADFLLLLMPNLPQEFRFLVALIPTLTLPLESWLLGLLGGP
jgi:hypothetical protein